MVREVYKWSENQLRDPFDAIRHGLCYLSEDRKNEVKFAAVKWTGQRPTWRGLPPDRLSAGKEVSVADSLVEMLDVRTPSLNRKFSTQAAATSRRLLWVSG